MKTEQDVNQILNELSGLSGITSPVSRSELRRLRLYLRESSLEESIKIYVGSCPDYSHKEGLYTHESLDSGVPLLTDYHLDSDIPFLRILERYGVSYSYTVMVADVEASDEYFQKKFSNGSEQIFLERCRGSVEATRYRMEGLSRESFLKGTLTSSSFYNEFGRERFLDYQSRYQDILKKAFTEDDSFNRRVSLDINERMNLYAKMYPEVVDRFGYLDENQIIFLVGRTLRTMAQYLTLGRLVTADSTYPIIINHPSRNNGMFNDRNKFPLPEDGSGGTQLAIPVFEMGRKVY